MRSSGYASKNHEGDSKTNNHANISSDQIQKKKKIVSDLMALRRMKYQEQSRRQGSPFNLNISPLPDIESDHIKSEDIEPIIQDTILREELGRMHGKEALNRAAEHFSILSNYADASDKQEEAETKRVKFVSNITQRRRLKMEKDRERRMHKQQSLMNKQIDLTQKELTFLSKSGGDISALQDFEVEDLPQLVENTEKNLKSMERNLRILKIKYANDLLAQFREMVLKAQMESLKKHHPEGFQVATQIIDEILEKVEEKSKINEGNAYESQLLEQLLVTDRAQYDKLEFQMVVANANLEVSNTLIEEVCAILVPEICNECFSLALISAVYPDDVIIQSASSSVLKLSKSKLKANSSNIKIIDDSYDNIRQNRELFRNGLWYHTLASLKKDLSAVASSPTQSVPQAKAPAVDTGEGASITSETVKPKLHTKFGDSAVMRQHTIHERALWKSYTITAPETPLPPKRAVAINVASLSNDHKLLALGSYKGDILVYDVTANFRLIRSVVYYGKKSDCIILLQWSLDSSRLISMSAAGCVVVWSVTFSPYVSKSDISALDISSSTYNCQQLTALSVLETTKGDFNLKDGAPSFSEGVNGNFKPTIVQFHPSVSAAASQDSIVLAVQNGLIMKLNLANNFFTRFGSNLVSGLRRNVVPVSVVFGQAPIPSQKIHKIGQDIEVELFRFHRTKVIQLCFVRNGGDMISIDEKLAVAQWRHKAEHLNSFGWFVPYKKYQLSFSEEILLSHGDDEVVFEDAIALKKKSKKNKSKKIVEQERKRALREIDDLDIKNQKPWYTDEFGDSLEKSKSNKPPKRITRIYAPSDDVIGDASFSGARFAIVTLKRESNLLLKLAYRGFEISTNPAVNLLQSVVSSSGDRIHFMLLYNEHLPRTRKHISFIELDLEAMQLGRIGPIQIEISSKRFDKCQKGMTSFFSLSRVDNCTGTECIVSNIDGDVRVHSLLSGRTVIQKPYEKDTKNLDAETPLFPSNVKRVNPESRLLFAKPDGDVSYIVILPLLVDQTYVPMRTIKISDSSLERERKLTQSTYKALVATKRRSAAGDAGEIGWFDPEQTAQREVWGHRHMPLPLYMELLLNTVIDVAIARAINVRMPQDIRKKTWKQDWARMQTYFPSAEQL